MGLYDAGRDDGRCWIAYQLISGQTLSHIRDIRRPPIPESVRIVRELAMALDHAHSRGVFHRDLKPANVMIDDTGRTRLTDFGLARRGDLDSDLTIEGTVLGTPHYMSPEAAAGRSNQADARSDVYSLGVILYELICGRKPADLPTCSPPWRFKPNPTPPTPRSVDRSVPSGLDRVCMKALAFNPADRFADAKSFADALAPYLGPRSNSWSATSDPGPDKTDANPDCPARGKCPRMIGAGVAVLILAVGLAVGLRPGAPPAAAPAPEAPPSTPGADIVDPGPVPVPTDPPHVHPSEDDGNPPAPPSATTESAEVAPSGEPSSPNTPVIGNKNKKTFHRPGCPALATAFESNKKEFADADAALAEDYTPCGRCKPTQPVAPPGTTDDA